MNIEHDRVDVRGVLSFVLIAYLPAWLMTLPMWLTGQGLTWTWAPVVLATMMFMPAVAGFVVTKWISPRPRKPLRVTGVTNPGGLRAWWRYGLIAWFGPPLIMLIALGVGYMLNVYDADWTGFSGLAEQIKYVSPSFLGKPIAVVAMGYVGQVFLTGWLNVIPAFGEEGGWRGYLLPALLPLGQPGAFLVSGALWGLWHGPLLVLGYDYPNVPVVVAFIMMVCFCGLVGTLLGWLRLASRSVWPSAIAHGFLNASAGLSTVFSSARTPVDNASVGLLGWTGWLVIIVIILLLIMLGKLPVELPAQREGISRGVPRRSRK